ncbi:PaaI family thioesterase [Deinococcus hopiensis]|uniref:Medium/long-chain acyl-CoA thioesterase YigI n=1 Tax=Deinococcus hopiensis KR-140 TaxID=695939 RepID=A0A1W1UF09_9DEIO|nr:PaaI family thioesterase [Deinococcus hopiensis]SMB79685.1 uncharacterized domain 1-containing protein [Deinococcus hopiensis KR-140]
MTSPGPALFTHEGRQAFLARATGNSGFTRFMGTELTRFEPGVVEISLPLRTDLTQHHGHAHGAVLGYLADTVCAWTAATVVGDVVTAEYKINFLAPARGETLWARGEVLRPGRRQVVVRAEVYARSGGEDTLVAAALATVAAVGERQDSGKP